MSVETRSIGLRLFSPQLLNSSFISTFSMSLYSRTKELFYPLALGAALLTSSCGSRTAVGFQEGMDGGNPSDARPPLDAIIGYDSGRHIFNKIAFVSDRDGNFEVYVLDVELGTTTRITNDPALDSRPSWSPDGQQLVYSHNPDGKWSIYTAPADGSAQPQKVVDGIEAKRSPYGLVYAALSPEETMELYLLDSTGMSRRLTKGNMVGLDISLSRDGRKAAYKVDNSDLGQGYGLAIVELETGIEHKLPNTVVRLNTSPHWCPDDSIVYHGQVKGNDETVNGNTDIYRTAQGWEQPQQLTDHPSEDSFPDCSPQGSTIAFESRREGNFQVYAQTLDGMVLRKVSTNGGEFPRWTKDGVQVAFLCRGNNNTSDICMANADGSNERNLTNNDGEDFDFEPDR